MFELIQKLVDRHPSHIQPIRAAEQLKKIGLPTKLIFIDVNGTLIQEEGEAKFDEIGFGKVREIASSLQTEGYSIGLCSDSSARKLINLAESLGINGPIIAENGNIIKYKEKTIVIEEIKNRSGIINRARKILNSGGFQETEDKNPLQFSGKHADYEKNEWAFGSDRLSSISIYANAEAIKLFDERAKEFPNVSIDSTPEYESLIIHPKDYRQNKGKALTLIREIGQRVIMIGNTLSDWVDPSSGVECGFVENSRIPNEIRNKSAYVSRKHLAFGVADILTKISRDIPGHVDILEKFTDGEINETFLVEHDSFPAVLQYKNRHPNFEWQHLSSYFHTDKLRKAIFLSNLLNQYEIHVPKIISHKDDSPISWAIFELVPGENLSLIFPNLSEDKQIQIAKEMATILGKIHSIPESEIKKMPQFIEKEINPQVVLNQTVEILSSVGVISKQTAKEIVIWYSTHYHEDPSQILSLVHRDFFQKNVFVDPDSLRITGVIDWGDTAHIGNPNKDAVLSAKWIAGDLSTQQGINIFRSFLTEYNAHVQNPINIDIALKQLNVYAMEWYLEAALFTMFTGDLSLANKQVTHIKNILASST